MKIVVTGTRGLPGVQGGVESHCEHLYTHLVKQGCNVTIFAREAYVPRDITTFKGIRIIPVSCPQNKFLEAIVHTFKCVLQARRLRPDILHIHAVGPSLFVPFARALGMRVVVTNHGPDYLREKWALPAKLFLMFCERVGTMSANSIITIAVNIAENIKKRYGKDSTVIPNGVNIPKPADTDEYLIKHGIEKGRYIIAVGRFVPEKGFDDLISAFNRIKLTRWKLVLVGDADYEDKYSRTLKAKAGENQNIVLTGFIKGRPLHELYTNAGIFVIPSYYEGLPIVLLEAMSYGLSCIASDIPANRNIDLPEERFFCAGDIDQLSKKISQIIKEPLDEESKRQQLNMISEKYSWNKIANKTLRVYKSVHPKK